MKEETLEEAADNYTIDFATMSAFKLGAKWQAEIMYSEEDMRNVIELTLTLVGNHWSDIRFELDTDRFKSVRSGIEKHIQSLQQTSWEVEVEMETPYTDGFTEDSVRRFYGKPQPKITNNSIKVIRLK